LSLSVAALLALSSRCAPQVAPSTLSAIVMAESAGNPFAIGVNKGGRIEAQPRDREEAVAAALQLLQQGANIDLGLGQINSTNLSALGLTVDDAFEPCRNIAAAASILSQSYLRATARGVNAPLAAALSAYNTGSMTGGVANGYVAKVYRAAAKLVPGSGSEQAQRLPANPSVDEGQDDPRPAFWDVFALQQWRERQRQNPPGPKLAGATEGLGDAK
jgi:type IV secretion system protein VirB1